MTRDGMNRHAPRKHCREHRNPNHGRSGHLSDRVVIRPMTNVRVVLSVRETSGPPVSVPDEFHASNENRAALHCIQNATTLRTVCNASRSLSIRNLVSSRGPRAALETPAIKASAPPIAASDRSQRRGTAAPTRPCEPRSPTPGGGPAACRVYAEPLRLPPGSEALPPTTTGCGQRQGREGSSPTPGSRATCYATTQGLRANGGLRVSLPPPVQMREAPRERGVSS
jgi:hypothetical protein